MTVEWDADKDVQNKRKHGVSFAEAQEVFRSGLDYLEVFDRLHSEDEDRFVAIGPAVKGIMLVVWTEREQKTIRIIIARLATKKGRDLYHTYMERHW